MGTQYATKEDMNYAAQVQKKTFVKQETGKSLVSDDAITKLESISEGAQANVIESIKVNGVAMAARNKEVDITVLTEEQVQEKINTSIAGVYKVKGSVAFASLPTNAKAGYVYNVTDKFTTTAAFVEGAGKEYPAGTNIVWTEDGKWDCMAGIYDFSDYLKASDIQEITEAEIDAMYNS